MKLLRLFAILLTLVAIARAGEADDVKSTFDGYKAAILSQNGTRAVELVSKQTIAEYQQYLDWAMGADRKTVESLSFINRFQVLLIRHRIPAEVLRSLNGRTIFAYAVDRDWIGKNGTIRLSLGQVEVASDRATAEILVSGEKTPARMQFIKEDSIWRYDMVPTIRDSNPALVELAKQRKKPENEFIFELIETVSGRKIPDTIWDPVK